jgi:peptidoglycan-associated lipoprotein
MKFTSLVSVTCMAAVLALGAVGCKKKPTGTTPLGFNPPGGTRTGPANPFERGTPIQPDLGATTSNEIPGDPNGGENTQSGNRDINAPGRTRNTDQFASETIYFDLDKAIVKQQDMGKIATVADFISKNPSHDILVEGHCDERGTEGYNLALGDRRALAIRDALISAGAPADNIHTVSFGESRPADPGHTQSAWAKNRRGVFVLVLPAQ